MLNVVKKQNFSGVDLCFLLDITWLNTVYRFSTFDILINEGTAAYYYHGSLGEIDFTQILGREIDIDGDSIPIEIIFINKDLVKLRFEGHTLDYAECKLYYVTVRNGVVLQSYNDRVPIAAGVVSDPIYGEINTPAGYVTFSIENGLDVEATPLLTAKDVIDQGQGHGKFLPIIIGRPCGEIAYNGGNNIFSLGSSPAYLYPNTPEDRIYIAAHPITASQVYIQDQDGTVVTKTVYNRPNLAYTGSSGLSVGDNSNTRIFVRWGYEGGGLRNPSTGEAVNGAGDLLRYMLQLTNYNIDGDAIEGVREYLNTWQFDGYINEEIDALEFIDNNMVGILPFYVHNGPRGIRPILDLFNAMTLQTEIIKVFDGPDFRIISGLEPLGSNNDICNHLIFRSGYSELKQAYTMTIEIDPRVDLNNTGAMRFSTIYADSSFNRYGLKTKIIEHDYIGDFTTACSLARDYVRRHAYVGIKITIQANVSWGWLDLGDIIAITSTRLHMTNHKAQIIKKTWIGAGWQYDARIDDSSLNNSRPVVVIPAAVTDTPDAVDGSFNTAAWYYISGNSQIPNDSSYVPRTPFAAVDGNTGAFFTFWNGGTGAEMISYKTALSGSVTVRFSIIRGGGGSGQPSYNIKIASSTTARVFHLTGYDWVTSKVLRISTSTTGHTLTDTWTPQKTITKTEITNTGLTVIEHTFNCSNEFVAIESNLSTGAGGWAIVDLQIIH